MASPTDTQFGYLAGQEVVGGIRSTPYNQPTIVLGDSFNATALANLTSINGLLPKIGRTIIHDTMVFRNPLDRIFNQLTDPFGVATEHAAFLRGSQNIKSTGVCAPQGNVAMASQLTASNFAINENLEIFDREVNGALLSNAEIARYVAQKMRTIEKNTSETRFTAEKLVLSNVVPGSRSITSSTQQDGTGTSVSYSSKPAGYCGKVDVEATWTIPEIARFSSVALVNSNAGETIADLALHFLQRVKDAAADMAYPANDDNKLSVNTFNGSRPWLVMENKVLNAFDAALMNSTSANGYNFANARQYISQFADLVEIDAFAALPTYDNVSYPGSTDYTGKRLACVMLDKDAPWAITKYESMESMRCMGRRSTSYNFQLEQDLAIYEGAPSYCLIVDA